MLPKVVRIQTSLWWPTTIQRPVLSHKHNGCTYFTTIDKHLYIAWLSCIWWFLWILLRKASKNLCEGRTIGPKLFYSSTIHTQWGWITMQRSSKCWPDMFSTQISLNHCLRTLYLNTSFYWPVASIYNFGIKLSIQVSGYIEQFCKNTYQFDINAIKY